MKAQNLPQASQQIEEEKHVDPNFFEGTELERTNTRLRRNKALQLKKNMTDSTDLKLNQQLTRDQQRMLNILRDTLTSNKDLRSSIENQANKQTKTETLEDEPRSTKNIGTEHSTAAYGLQQTKKSSAHQEDMPASFLFSDESFRPKQQP